MVPSRVAFSSRATFDEHLTEKAIEPHMPPIEMLLSFCFVALVVELTPGPNMGYIAVLSAGRGQKVGLAAVLGIAAGLLFIGGLVAVGVAGVVQSSPTLYQGLRVAGVVYLLWLAYETWHDELDTSPDSAPRTGANGNGGYFLRGFAANVLNPKAAVFYVSLLPRFVDPSRNALTQTLSLTVVYVAIATAVHLAIVLAASRAAPFLQSPERMRVGRRAAALLLVLVAIWFAVTTGRS